MRDVESPPMALRSPLREASASTLKRTFWLLLIAGLWCMPISAQPAGSADWVEQTLASMTLEQRAGAVLLPRVGGSLLGRDDAELSGLLEQARQGLIGGVVIFGGDALSGARTIELLQQASRWPLLVGIDAEWGPGMRLDGAAVLPRAMAFGAADALDLSQAAGELTARQARALGAHLVLAPVVDLAIDPRGLIGTRSYGSNPERVARHAGAFVRGVEQGGALSVAKHFPGHGAVSGDSHIELPVLEASSALMRRRELVPFAAAARAGVDGIMPGHLLVPAVDETEPASRSEALIEDLLRGELGFGGLVVSDALDMSGARIERWDGAVAVRSLAAGNDLLLLPPNAAVARQAIVRAVTHGKLSRERLDEAATRTLRARARLGLTSAGAATGSGDLASLLRSGEAERLARRVAEQAVTVVADPVSLLPISSRRPPRLLVIELLPRGRAASSSEAFISALRRRAQSVERWIASPLEAAHKLRRLASEGPEVDQVVVASFVDSDLWLGDSPETSDNLSLASLLTEVLRRLPGEPPAILVGFGEPWTLAGAPDTWALVATYDRTGASQEAVASALFGEIPWRGTLPVAVGEWREGGGVAVERSLPLLQPGAPDLVGMSRGRLDVARSVLEQAVADRVTPGAVALVARRGRIVLHEAVGQLTYDEPAGATALDTIYDLASLTKVVATTTLVKMLVERGWLDLDHPVERYIEGFSGGGRERVEVRDLLAHSSGVLWWTDLYLRHAGASPGEAKDAALAEILELELTDPPRTKTTYSDLGILLLGEIIERVSGRSLGDLADEWIFGPLGMTRTFYRPPLELRSVIAPTELDPWRSRVVVGEVHDENAFALGGVAPHAGLFATAADLGKFAQMLLNGGYYDGRRLLNGSTIASFTQRAELIEGSSRAYGWDTPSGRSSAGRFFSAKSFGHTGFTGTSLWIDPERDLLVVLLTNRVHPTRENRKIRELRPAFHDAVVQAIVDEPVEPRSSQ